MTNTSGATEWIPIVDLDLFNGGGTLIGSVSTTAGPQFLAPGETAPFDYLVSPTTYPGFATYHITGASASAASQRANHNFTTSVTSVSVDWINYTHIVGTVANNNNETCAYVFAYFTFYGAGGAVVDDDIASVNTTDGSLGPLQTASFELLRGPDRPAYSSYRILTESTTAPLVVAPSAPNSAVAVAGDHQAQVSWTAPSSDGNADITGYTVVAHPGGQSTSVPGTARSASVLGLTNGTPYTFTVAAQNSAGLGPTSAPSNAVTPAGVPTPPASVSATAGDGAAVVSWSAAGANGSPLLSYVVVASPGGSRLTVPANDGSVAIAGLTNNVPYTFSVNAINAVGSGAQAVTAAVTPTSRPAAGGVSPAGPAPRVGAGPIGLGAPTGGGSRVPPAEITTASPAPSTTAGPLAAGAPSTVLSSQPRHVATSEAVTFVAPQLNSIADPGLSRRRPGLGGRLVALVA